jgi:hypothetical protein
LACSRGAPLAAGRQLANERVEALVAIAKRAAEEHLEVHRGEAGLDPGSAAARIWRVAYERIGLAIARGLAQQLLARLGCVDVCRVYRN